MFLFGPNYVKLKKHLNSTLDRLRLLRRKKVESVPMAKKEIARDIVAGNIDAARTKARHLMRDDSMVEAMELLEIYCNHLLARFGLIQYTKTLDDVLLEATSSIIWAAPRWHDMVPEIKAVADVLTSKYGKKYADACKEETLPTVSEKLIKQIMTIRAPSERSVENYLAELVNNYNVAYVPSVRRVSAIDTELEERGDTNLAEGESSRTSNIVSFDLTADRSDNDEKRDNCNPDPLSVDIPIEKSEVTVLPDDEDVLPPYRSLDEMPKPPTISKLPTNELNEVELRDIPSGMGTPTNAIIHETLV